MFDGAKVDINTLLLLHFDGDFKDSTGNFTLNNTGAVIDTSHGKFGSKSAYFGNGLLIFPNKQWFSDLLSSGNYTIEFWMKKTFDWNPISFTNEIPLSDDYAGDTLGYILCFEVEPDGKNFIMYGNYINWQIFNFKNHINQGDWNFIAVTSKDFYHRVFINGNIVGERANFHPTLRSHKLCIGGREGPGSRSTGYYNEFRISDIARWTSNFTPPTKPY